MKSFILSSFFAVSTLLIMAQPPDLTDISDKSSSQVTDTTYVEGTHTTERERRGLPADSTKQTRTTARKASTKHTHTESHKTQKRTSASAK